MTLTLATILTGLGLLILGAAIWKNPPSFEKKLRTLHRSQNATLVLLVMATLWVLWNVLHLAEADFGKYKFYLFAFFLCISIGAWFFVPDFLGIRALSVILLLISGQLLQSAFFEEPGSRLLLVGFAYFVIVLSLYWAVVPYRFRDWVFALYNQPSRRRTLGLATVLYGILLTGLPFTY